MASAGMGHRYEVPGEGLRGVIYDMVGCPELSYSDFDCPTGEDGSW